MAVPIVEQIAVKLAARLGRIATANGYTFDANVVRPTRVGKYVPRDKEVVFYQGGRTQVEKTEGNPAGVSWKQEFVAAVFAIDSDKSVVPIDTLVNVRQADVEKALATVHPDETEADWAKVDALALEADFDEPREFAGAESKFSGVEVPLLVTYRVKENDPYTQA